MILPFVSALLVLAGQPVNEIGDENTIFSERQPVRLEPLPAARALAAFRDICMTSFADPAAFNAAAAASDLGFVQTADAGRGTHEWSSRHGQIVLRQMRRPERLTRRDRQEGHGRRERWRERCDFWVAIEEQIDSSELVAVIGAQLAPQSTPREEIVGVSWELESSVPGTSLRLVYLPSFDDPRIFTLSLQRLTDSPR